MIVRKALEEGKGRYPSRSHLAVSESVASGSIRVSRIWQYRSQSHLAAFQSAAPGLSLSVPLSAGEAAAQVICLA